MADTNPYATPQSAAPQLTESSRRTKTATACLIAPLAGGTLPRRCVVCNAAPLDEPMKLMIPTMPASKMRAIYLVSFVFGGPIFWLILAAVERVKFMVFLCPEHHRREKNAKLIVNVTLMMGTVLAVLGIVSSMNFDAPDVGMLLALLGVVAIIGAISYQMFRSKPLITVDVKKESIWLKGADPQFIAEFAQPVEGE